MRLKRCYIADFGTLHDFSYEFKEGLNTICQENGWGKTTFGVFIKAMFYGLEYAPRKKTADNERKKYYPWQGGNFGGSLEFVLGEKEYKIERYFGKRDKEDTFCLYDQKTGLVSRDFSERIGEELFQIDAASYERSTYIPQNGIAVSMTDSINAKLSNLVENGNDINNYENAYARLEEHLKEYKKTGGRGKLPQLEEQIRAKQEAIDECENKAAGIQLVEEQIREQEKIRQTLQLRRQEIQDAILRAGARREQAAKKEHFDTLKKREAEVIDKKAPLDQIFAAGRVDESLISSIEAEVEELHRLRDERAQIGLNKEEADLLVELDEFFAAGCPDSPEIEMYLGESREYDGAKEELIKIQARLDLLKMQQEQEEIRLREEREQQQRELREALEASRAKAALWQRIFLTAGIIALAVGIACFLLSPVAGLPGVLAGILFIVLAVGKRPRAVREMAVGSEQETEPVLSEELRQEMEQLQEELEQKKARQQEAEAHYQIFLGQFPFPETGESPVQLLTRLEGKAAQYRRLSEKEREQREQKKELAGRIEEKTLAVQKRLEAVHPKYTKEESLREACERLRADSAEYERLIQELAGSREELREFEANNKELLEELAAAKEDRTEDADGEEEVSLEELRLQNRECERELEEVDGKIHSYRKDKDALSVIADRQTEFEEELESLKNEYREAVERAGILEKTMQYLKEAKESFSTHYMGAMRRGFTKYASRMSKADGRDICLDVQLEAQIEAGGALRGSEYFSTGSRDFVGICIRLALIEALFEKEKPFILLDDPFVNLDDDKVENARKLLKEIAQDYQVIYLVCHTSRV